MGFKNPLISGFMVICLASLSGLPPTSGFFAKFFVLAELFSSESYIWLAVVAIINSVISLYYYFRIVKSMYFLEDESEKESLNPVEPNLINKWVIIILSIQPLIFYIYWWPLQSLIESSITMFKG